MPDNDLTALFPTLAQQLENWDGRQAAGDGHDDPSHAGVTDEDIEAYLRQTGSLRAPLSPLVSGQQAPPAPEFAPGSGRPAPPAHQATVEPPQAPPQAPPTEPPTIDGSSGAEGQGEGAGAEPPSPPPPPDFYEIAGRRYDRRQAEAWAQFDNLVAGDPQLRDLLTNYLQGRGRAPGGQQGGSPAPDSQPQAPTALPPLPPEYADDPTVSALYNTVQQQQAILDRVSRQATQAEQIATSQAQRTYTDIAQGAMSEFQRTMQLDDTVMQEVASTAARMGFAEKYMSGMDPLTGAPVAPDPYKAVMAALQAGYFVTPSTRQLDVQRESQKQQQLVEADRIRKEKLSGVSGAAGSVPRTQAVPNNPKDARAAMTEEISQMFNGSWVGDGS